MPTTVSLECGALIILVVVVLFWQRFQGWSSSTGFGFLWPSLISEVVYVLGLIRHSNATGAVCGMCCLDTTLAEDVFCFYGFDMWIVVYAVHSLLHIRVCKFVTLWYCCHEIQIKTILFKFLDCKTAAHGWMVNSSHTVSFTPLYKTHPHFLLNFSFFFLFLAVFWARCSIRDMCYIKCSIIVIITTPN